jgi:hypothetical protein
VTSALITVSVAQQESDTRKAKFWSVTEYSKNLSSQCNLTAQKEQVQDKILYVNISLYQSLILPCIYFFKISNILLFISGNCLFYALIILTVVKM